MSDQCAVCGAPFASPAELLAHTHKEHSSAAPTAAAPPPTGSTAWFRCALCGQRFGSPEELRRHNLSPHGRLAAPRPRPTG